MPIDGFDTSMADDQPVVISGKTWKKLVGVLTDLCNPSVAGAQQFKVQGGLWSLTIGPGGDGNVSTIRRVALRMDGGTNGAPGQFPSYTYTVTDEFLGGGTPPAGTVIYGTNISPSDRTIAGPCAFATSGLLIFYPPVGSATGTAGNFPGKFLGYPYPSMTSGVAGSNSSSGSSSSGTPTPTAYFELILTNETFGGSTRTDPCVADTDEDAEDA